MQEALTESFCERCGTRYEFEAPTQLNTLRKTRGLVSGLKNFIMSQDTLTDAIGDAMRSEEEAIAANQLEAFHDTFNFCIDCRQYACNNCWNDAASRCRSCVPIPGKDDLSDRMEAAYLADHSAMHAGPVMAPDEISRRLGVEAWPEHDLATAPTNGHIAEGAAVADEWLASVGAVETPGEEPTPQSVVADEAPAIEWAETELHPILGWEDDSELEVVAPYEAALPEAEWIAAEADQEPVDSWTPAGESVSGQWESVEPALAAELEAEPMLAAFEPAFEPEPVLAAEPEPVLTAEPEPVLAAEPEPEPVVAEVAEMAEPEPEPMVAEMAEPEPEPMVAEVAEPPAAPEPAVEPEPIAPPEPPAAREPRRIIPISETIIKAPRRTPKPVVSAEQVELDEAALAARKAQLEVLGIEDPGVGAVSQERRILPYRSSGAAATPSELVQRTLGGVSALWDASAREVAAARSAVAVQNCDGCGLSLSASARFCRRCGTRQAQPA
jgi:hypothetical protein